MEPEYGFTEEIKEAKNLVEKDMLLQKYGLIAPKLTPLENLWIRTEEAFNNAEGNNERT